MKTRFTALLVGALLTASSLCAQVQPKANDKTPDKPRWTEIISFLSVTPTSLSGEIIGVTASVFTVLMTEARKAL